MVSLARSDAVLRLGKRLVAQLQAGDDLLASWMAHDIADRINHAENAAPDARAAANDACARAILDLWRYRNVLPQHVRPLGELEPVLRTLASLDVDQADHNRYYAATLRAAAAADAVGATKEWLEAALGLDYTARLLIRHALRAAMSAAGPSAESWVELARLAGADGGAEGPTIRIIIHGDRTSDVDHEKARREQDAARLEAMAALALDLADELRKPPESRENSSAS